MSSSMSKRMLLKLLTLESESKRQSGTSYTECLPKNVQYIEFENHDNRDIEIKVVCKRRQLKKKCIVHLPFCQLDCNNCIICFRNFDALLLCWNPRMIRQLPCVTLLWFLNTPLALFFVTQGTTFDVTQGTTFFVIQRTKFFVIRGTIFFVIQWTTFFVIKGITFFVM